MTKALKAGEIAGTAANLVAGDRDRQHGQKRDNFARIAAVWDAYLNIRRDTMAPLRPVDVGHMMVLMKIARTQSGAVNADDYIDAAGYAACAGEIALQEAVDTSWVEAKIKDKAGWNPAVEAEFLTEVLKEYKDREAAKKAIDSA